MESNSKILVPLKLEFLPTGCISVGDSINLKLIGSLTDQVSIVSKNCVFRADCDVRRCNGGKLMNQLRGGGLTGKVFALFPKSLIVEILIGDWRYHLCNKGN